MGFLDKVKFWKKDEDDFDFDKLAQQEIDKDPFLRENHPGNDALNPQPTTRFGKQQPSAFEQPNQFDDIAPQPRSLRGANAGSSDTELINSKLDTLKAMLSSIEQRLAHLEQSLGNQDRKRLW